jgi:hypothetical protein
MNILYLILIIILILCLINNIKEKFFFKENLKKFDMKYIYDVFHNDMNNLIIIMPAESYPPTIEYINSKTKNNINFKLYICPHKHTYIYESLIHTKYIKNIELLINNEKINIKVNKYPEFKNEIIMSTIVYNEDKYIIQWIEFHMNIGITRFIIYDNTDKKKTNSDLPNLLEKYIKKGIVLLIKWSYPYRLPISGISGQTTQQNHSIYAFKNSKFIGLFDIDEYINMKNNININTFFDSLIKNKKINTKNIGSFRILNKNFTNPYNLSEENYDFLSIYTCDKVTIKGKEKNFVIPKNVNTFSVHTITNGKKMFNVNSKYIYFNHYVFLNKSNRGKNKYKFKDDSILKHCNFIKFLDN